MDSRLILIISAVVIAVAIVIIKNLGAVKADDLTDILAGKKYKLIDVRTTHEFSNGHVKDAKNIPLDTLSKRIEKFAPNKETALLLYCRSGARSGHAKRNLIAMGYKNVRNLGSLHHATELMK